MKTISILEAEKKFVELVADASRGEPQFIKSNGVKIAVLISYEEYQRSTAQPESLATFLLNSPLRGSSIDLDRDGDLGRKTLDFSEGAE